MYLHDFDFELPDELIAQDALADRSASRLLVTSRSGGLSTEHRHFHNIIDYFGADDVIVLNRSRVVKARLLGQRSSGGRVEILFLRKQDDGSFLAWVRPRVRLKPGEIITVNNGDDSTEIRFVHRVGERDAELCVQDGSIDDVLDRFGHVPLPPYIQRGDTGADLERYQTVYAEERGSVAAPTAGLHFTDALLKQLMAGGTEVVTVVLHVGPGTFSPLTHDRVTDNSLQSERFYIDAEQVAALARARRAGKCITAVGTTTARTLESAAGAGLLDAAGAISGDTDLFIYPGYEFQLVDQLITNFHLPSSSLLMLVAALAGREHILDCYRDAVARAYRFYSYGDAMLIRSG